MTYQVYRIRSTVELPLEDLNEFIENADFPPGIKDVNVTRRNNTLILKAVPAKNNFSKYTPPAQLKASIREKRVYETEDGEWKDTLPENVGNSRPGWGNYNGQATEEEEEEEVVSKLMEYAGFKGDRETVLQNTELRYPMFQVLCDLARYAGKGSLAAITADNDKLEATRIIDGEDRAVTIEIVEDPSGEASDDSVDWRNNKFINDN